MAGWTRLFNDSFGGQASWLLPAALILLAAGGWLVMRRRVLPVLGGIAIMLAVSPLAAVSTFLALVGVALLVNPALLEKLGPIAWPGWR